MQQPTCGKRCGKNKAESAGNLLNMPLREHLLWFGKGGHIFFVSFVCDVEGMTCLVYTHYESFMKKTRRHWRGELPLFGSRFVFDPKIGGFPS